MLNAMKPSHAVPPEKENMRKYKKVLFYLMFFGTEYKGHSQENLSQMLVSRKI